MIPSAVRMLMLGLVMVLATGAAVSAAPSGAGVKALQPATSAGAVKTIAHYRASLERPAGLVSDQEIAFCGRYLPIAVDRVHDDAAAGSEETPQQCLARIDGLTAMAQCQWLGGDVTGARATLATLTNQRCPGATGDGLERSMLLSERWWDAESLAAPVAALSPERRKAATKRLAEVTRRRSFALASLGGKPLPSRGALLVLEMPSGSPIARSGVRVGDIVEIVDAAPTTQPDALKTRLARDARHSVMYWHEGKRLETVVRGKGPAPRTVALPERLN